MTGDRPALVAARPRTVDGRRQGTGLEDCNMTRERAEEAKQVQPSSGHDDERERRSRAKEQTSWVAAIHRSLGNRAIQRLADGDRPIVATDGTAERRAERVADAAIDPVATPATPAPVDGRRIATEPAERNEAPATEGVAPPIVESVVGTPGRHLRHDVRTEMEARFGRPFGDVRVHTGPRAAASAESVNARAYTVGSDVVFDRAGHDPTSASGTRLLAHELAHVVQQRGGGGPVLQRQEADTATEEVDVGAIAGAASNAVWTTITRAAARSRLESMLEQARPAFLDRVDPTGENLAADVERLQLFLWDEGVLPFSVLESEYVSPRYTPFSRQIGVEEVPETLAAFRQYLAAERRGHSMAGVAKLIRTLREKTDEAKRQRAAMELRQYVRGLLSEYPQRVEDFLLQPGMSADRKTAVLGELRAAIARMEFLTGTIVMGGSGDPDAEKPSSEYSWETGPNDLVGDYGLDPWCSRFATTIRAMITGKEVVQSGYRLGPWEVGGTDVQHVPDFSEGYGGAFAGPGQGTYGGKSVPDPRDNPWADLRSELDGESNRADRERTVDQFFEDHLTPQAGDYMVVRRPSAPANQFSGSSQSHTTMIEKRQGYTLYTIEGNKADRVTGRVFDLTDPTHVREIIWIGRESILSARPTGTASERREARRARRWGLQTRAAVEALPLVSLPQVEPAEILDPVNRINRMLRALATAEGYVDPVAGDVDTVATMVKTEIGPTKGSSE